MPCAIPLEVAIRALLGEVRVTELLLSHVQAPSVSEQITSKVFVIFLIELVIIEALSCVTDTPIINFSINDHLCAQH